MSKRVVNKIVAFTLIIATIVFFQGTGNSYADIPKTTTPNPTISNVVVKTNEQVTNKQTTNKTNVKVNVKKISIDTVTRKSGTISVSWKKNKKANGYRIQYSKDKDFKNVKNKNVKSASKTKTKIAKVNKSKNYYVRVSAYVKKNNKKYYSEWSNVAEVIAWNTKWEFAKNSKIHTDSPTLYFSNAAKKKNKTVCVNAGHGTKGGESVKTLCHPDGSSKVTGGSTSQGAITATSINGGTTLADGTREATATLKLAMTVKKQLLKEGYNVLMVRESDDAQLDNIARTVFANNNADYHIALHYDSTSSNKGAFYISVPNNNKYRSMYPVSKNWKKHNNLGKNLVNGMRSAGVKIYGSGSMAIDLTQTSYSTIPSVDLEVGDKRSDHSSKTLKKIAIGIGKGLNKIK